jgi:hypothetical protein
MLEYFRNIGEVDQRRGQIKEWCEEKILPYLEPSSLDLGLQVHDVQGQEQQWSAATKIDSRRGRWVKGGISRSCKGVYKRGGGLKVKSSRVCYRPTTFL